MVYPNKEKWFWGEKEQNYNENKKRQKKARIGKTINRILG